MAKRSSKAVNRKSANGLMPDKASKKIFKNKTNLDNGVQSKTLAMQIEDDVPCFPRGGATSLSRHEVDEVRAEADAEFGGLVRESNNNRRKKTLQKKNHPAEDDTGSLFGDGISGKLPRFANKITSKNVSPGMKIWGVIAEINKKDLVISLPGGLRGLVRACEAFDPDLDIETKDADSSFLSRTFRVGQLVSCIVLDLDADNKEKGNHKIWLSLRLALLYKGFTLDAIQEGMVLTAYVKSIEDHGYILSFGLPSFVGFLPKNDRTESRDDKVVGQLLQGVVRSIDRSRKVIYLSSDHDAVSKCVTKDVKGISIDLLIPGMMVNARVLSTLENGLILSFLTYFTGTVDIFNLENAFPTTEWKDHYGKNKKVSARILFLDPSTRAVGLTLNSHLLQNEAPPSLVKTGDIFDRAKIVRVDRGAGLLIEIPSVPVSTPAYVCISDVADNKAQKLDKQFQEGSNVRVRVFGFRHLEGLAIGVLKGSAFEGSVFTHSDVKPGMTVKAKILAVDIFGAIVQLTSGVKALCPLPHMSEFEIAKPGKKFNVGAELVFRVLGVKSKRITVTHKKTLVKSKLPVLSSYAEATDGLVTHGWITKIEKHGSFVRFYNGVQGFVPRSQLGLEPGRDTSTTYHVGQVVKCRVTSSLPASRRINLSFLITPRRASEDEIVSLGSLVCGVVEQVTHRGVIVLVNANAKGTISTDHLADHHEQASLMKSALKPGYKFDQLLVLDTEGENLVLTAKYSLVNSSQQLPLEISQISPYSIVQGYICNLKSGCFVRYLGRLTGFCPRSKAIDDQRNDVSEAFYVGQSVRSKILDVNGETGRITVSLKQSSCASTDTSFIQSYFLLEDKIAKLQMADSKCSEVWTENFGIGSIVEGKIHEAKEFGVVVSFEKYDDVFGFAPHYQLGGNDVETGTVVRAVVLDVSRLERVVDLSLKPEFVTRFKDSSDILPHKKKRKREANKELELHQTVNAVVEIVKEKENYMVLSLPEYNHAVGYASLTDYNIQKLPKKQFVNGQSVTATIMALPSPSTVGRLLLLLKSIGEVETSSSKRAKKKSGYNVGALVQAEITDIKPLELRLKFGVGFHGRVHITEATDGAAAEDPFRNLRIGQTLTARIVAKADKYEKNWKSHQWELSIRPSMLTDSNEIRDKLTPVAFNFSIGQSVTGYVYKVDCQWVWLTVSREVRAQIFFLDTSCEPDELQDLQKQFSVGKSVRGHILSINKEKRLLRLVLRPLSTIPNGNETIEDQSNDNVIENVFSLIREGSVVGGRISKVLPGVGGLLVEIGPHLYGKVHFTELTDSAPDPLLGYREGQFVKCKVLEVSPTGRGTVHVDLSLRFGDDVTSLRDRVDKIEDLQPNMIVKGYVKSVTPKGCFISLSRKLDAKILLSNLSDGFIESPEKEFPVGKLVIGKVLSVETLSRRVEVTLKMSSGSGALKAQMNDTSSLRVGDIISGSIRRVESYGLFITIDHTTLVGLCHISELSDDSVDSIESKYKAGERVKAKILKVDNERHRISLGMKNSHFGDDIEIQTPSKLTSDEDEGDKEEGEGEEVVDRNGQMDNTHKPNSDHQSQVEEFPVLAQVESRASILPLEVSLDDIEQADMDVAVSWTEEHAAVADTKDEKSKRRAKRKQKEDRELEIIAAEQRLLEKDMPRSAEEFEKVIRGSLNSSFVWIKYMAFMLSLADVDKARAIAERALKTINIREETEKLNVWVAYLNLENEYGNPPEEAVVKIFQRALQYCDPKKVHLALLAMYQRTEQHKLANELLDKMTKKFRHSCKVWLRRVQSLLKQHQDGVQAIVNRAVLSLPRHKHIKFISQTAILEFKCGVPDRGRSFFEGILREYPKRTDLWNIYLDQEIRLGDVNMTRALFERAISLSLKLRKMEPLLKKYLEFEKTVGDEERIEYVKKAALEYAKTNLGIETED